MENVWLNTKTTTKSKQIFIIIGTKVYTKVPALPRSVNKWKRQLQ